MNRVLLIAALAASAAIAQTPQTAKKTTEKSAPAQHVKEETTPQTDYVCGMTVDPKTAGGKYAYKGKMYYFCSREDQQEFTKSPDKYLPKK